MEQGENGRVAEPPRKPDINESQSTMAKLTRAKGNLSVFLSIKAGREPLSFMRYYKEHSNMLIANNADLTEKERLEAAVGLYDKDVDAAKRFIAGLEQEDAEKREGLMTNHIADMRAYITKLEEQLRTEHQTPE